MKRRQLLKPIEKELPNIDQQFEVPVHWRRRNQQLFSPTTLMRRKDQKRSRETRCRNEAGKQDAACLNNNKHVDAVKETSSLHDSSFANINRSPSSHNEPTVHDQKAVVGEKDNNKTLTETVTEMLTPAYTMVTGATQMIASKMQSPGSNGYEFGAKQVWDMGISVKEYLMHKLEPGEEDRALFAGEAQGEVGIVDKVKGSGFFFAGEGRGTRDASPGFCKSRGRSQSQQILMRTRRLPQYLRISFMRQGHPSQYFLQIFMHLSPPSQFLRKIWADQA